MRHQDLRMALAALVAFGPVMFAAAYGIANAGKLHGTAAPIAAAAPVHTASLASLDRPRAVRDW